MPCLQRQPCSDNPQSRAALWPALLRLLRFISLNDPYVSSACLSQGCGLDLEACLPRHEGLEQRMDGGTAALTFVGASLQVVKAVKENSRDYRDARKQALHAQHQAEQLHLTLKQLKELPPLKQERIAPVQASLNNIQEALPIISQPTRKRDRLRWIAGGKSKVEREISQINPMETSATFNLLVSLAQDM